MIDSTLQTAMDQITKEVYQNENYAFVSIAFADNTNLHRIRWYQAQGNLNQRYQKIILRAGIGIAGMVLRTGMPVLANANPNGQKNLISTYPIMISEALTNAVAIPIIDPETTLTGGVLLAGYRDGTLVENKDINILKKYLGDFPKKV